MDQPASTPSNEPVCPYCGEPGASGARCGACRGPLDPLSRQRTQNEMGPWFVRDPQRPFRPGCSYGALVGMVRRGAVSAESVLRGPTTRQFWRRARDTPGVAHFFGACHNCYAGTDASQRACSSCGASFLPEGDREHLGLAPVRPLPGDPPAEPPKSPGSPARAPDRGSSRASPGVPQPAAPQVAVESDQRVRSDPSSANQPTKPSRGRSVPVWVVVVGAGGLLAGVVLGVPELRRAVFSGETQSTTTSSGELSISKTPESETTSELDVSDVPAADSVVRDRGDAETQRPDSSADSGTEPIEVAAADSPDDAIEPPESNQADASRPASPSPVLLSELASLAIETDESVLNRRVLAWMGEGGQAERVAIRRLEQLRLGRLTRE